MSEAPTPSPGRFRSAGHILKNIVWSAASQFALNGLCPWEVEGRWVMLERREIYLPGLGDGLNGATIAHLSDLHCSPLVRDRYMLQYVEMVNRLEADFVVLTGDFIHASARHYARQIGKLLRGLSPRVEAMAVLGNHDYGLFVPRQEVVRGLGQYVAGQLDSAGIRVLINQSLSFTRGGSTIRFVGLDEFWLEEHQPEVALADTSDGTPVIALCHNPDAAPRLAELGADYILSGHTHGRPARDTRIHNLLFPKEHPHFIAGQYHLGQNRFVYVNRGIGPSRRCANTRPEVTLFTLRDADRTLGRGYPWAGTVTSVGIPAYWQRTGPPLVRRLP